MVKSFRHKGLRKFFETSSTSGAQVAHVRRKLAPLRGPEANSFWLHAEAHGIAK